MCINCPQIILGHTTDHVLCYLVMQKNAVNTCFAVKNNKESNVSYFNASSDAHNYMHTFIMLSTVIQFKVARTTLNHKSLSHVDGWIGNV